ncbi:hypothetical protein [Enterococcus rivorum]|uniref:Uncharacterized protein n=1 Tax=Enterococcus rivorum TaxID=762845 RepID=A0A1E5L0V8_9ENTE|nr:hypothetical protein [Enterococcus rivorum]MBP2098815.1 type II restriction/modification system DNA methylase subunit YeeA [Enterococcus rivorum]OEH83549.1 hypothetical protein BCR26_08695 [Enterococcus rivorum]
MTRIVKPFDELRIRRFPYDKKVRLMKKAGDKSLNQYLYEHLIKLADTEEVVDVQYRMVQIQKETNEIMEANTKVLMEVKELLRYINGGD